MAVSSPGRAPEGSRRREPPPRERTRSSLPESPRAAGPRRSARAARCPAPPCRAPGFGRPIQRRARPGLRPSRASFQSARSPNRRRQGFGARAASQRALGAARCARAARPPHRAGRRRFVAAKLSVRIQSRALGDRFIEPIIKAHAGAASRLKGGVAGPPADARDSPRHGSIHVLDHKSGAANRPEAQRRRRVSTLSGVVVKKRLRALSCGHRAPGEDARLSTGRPASGPPQSCR